MFARTERLLLRPGFPEDAAALASAIADEFIVRNLASAPWPFGEAEAADLLSKSGDTALPRLLMLERTTGEPRIVGSCGLTRRPSGAVELAYWVARSHWNRGLATEACAAIVEMAKALRLPRIDASVFDDNGASARVLEKLGFNPTPFSEPRYSCARGTETMSRLYRLSLAPPGCEDCPPPALAA